MVNSYAGGTPSNVFNERPVQGSVGYGMPDSPPPPPAAGAAPPPPPAGNYTRGTPGAIPTCADAAGGAGAQGCNGCGQQQHGDPMTSPPPGPATQIPGGGTQVLADGRVVPGSQGVGGQPKVGTPGWGGANGRPAITQAGPQGIQSGAGANRFNYPVTNGGQGTALYNPTQGIGVPRPELGGFQGFDSSTLDKNPLDFYDAESGGSSLAHIQDQYSGGNINDFLAGGNFYNPIAEQVGQFRASARRGDKINPMFADEGLRSGDYIRNADGSLGYDTSPAHLKAMAQRTYGSLAQSGQDKFRDWMSSFTGQ